MKSRLSRILHTPPPTRQRTAPIRDQIRPAIRTTRSARVVNGPVRYAVVGLGHIAQAAVLPAFAHARKNSVLAAFVSDNPKKHRVLGRRYKVERQCGYDGYEELLRSGDIDAVYIALPNTMHAEFTVRAANAHIHVLCEKPLAMTENECEQMVRACAENKVKLMTAYRLHFQKGNLEAIRAIRSGKIGEPRIFNSTFSMQVRRDNIRTQRELGGGTLWDLGVYCINAARYLFGEEPLSVSAFSSRNTDPRFREVDEMTAALLTFPEGRLATFVSSFGAADSAAYEVIGTKGKLRMENSYEYSTDMELTVEASGKTSRRSFGKSDQFGPELFYFSDCILRNRDPEPSGVEGLVDVHIVRALYESAAKGRPIRLRELTRRRRPKLQQCIWRPPIREPDLVEVEAPARD